MAVAMVFLGHKELLKMHSVMGILATWMPTKLHDSDSELV